MKFMKKLLSAVTAAAIGATMTTALSAGVSTASAASKTAVELVEDMGLGWNLGNALDCTNTWTDSPTPEQIETAWGNISTTESMIKEVKKAGFNTVRIPVTWWDMTGKSGTANKDTFDGTVGEAYLARVKEVVDYCVKNDMYAIINTHHDEDWEKDTSKIGTFEKLWKQIATYFKDYDEHLVFEGMNEVSFSTSDAMTYNQKFVDTVRATGGNNADRLLICTADSNNTAKALSGQFSMPTDSANMLAVSVHYYEPPTFCVADTTSSWGHRETWGTAADYSKLENDFSDLKSKFVDSGVGVIIGEYGVCNADKYGVNTTPYNKDQESVEKFLKAVASTAYDMTGVCPIVWDDSNSGTICLFNRKTLSWFDDNVKQIYSNIANGGSTDPDKKKTDRVTIQGSDITELDDKGKEFLNVDLKPYKDLGVYLTSVVVDYKMTSAKKSSQCSGNINMSFNVSDADGKIHWVSFDNTIGPNDTISTFEFPLGTGDYPTARDDNGNITETVSATLDMDYLKIQNWWTWSAATGDTVTVDLNAVTLIFDKEFYVDDNPDTTTTTTTTSQTTTTTTSATTTTTSATVTEPAGKVYGQVYLAGQGGTYQFWDVDSDGVVPVNITGNGTYTAEYDIMEGDGTGSLECLILDSNINLYQFLPESYKTVDSATAVKDCGVTFNVQKITLDGVDLAYTGPTDGSMCVANDSTSLRRNILNTWTQPSIEDINGKDLSLTSCLKVTFTVAGLPGGEEVTTEPTATTTKATTTTTTTQATTTTTTTQATTTTTTAATTTTSSAPTTTVSFDSSAFYGDVNLDGNVDLADAVLLNKAVAGTVVLNEQAAKNADCNSDGVRDANDSMVLLMFLVHLVNDLPHVG